MKRLIATVLCLAVAAAVFAAGGTEKVSGPTVTGSGPVNFPLSQPLTLKYISVEHSTAGALPYETDWANGPGGQWLKEQTNVTLDIVQVPAASANEKYQLMLATDTSWDIMYFHGTNLTDNDANDAGRKGIVVDLMDYKELIPNYLSYVNGSDPQFGSLQYKVTPEGNLYHFTWMYADMIQRNNFIHYRIDLWREHNLKTETWDDLYRAARTLKREYPKSFPLSAVNWDGAHPMIITTLAPMWRTSDKMFFDTLDTEQWYYGPTTDNWKAMIEWLRKMYQEELLHPEAWTMGWDRIYEAYIKNEIFMSPWGGQGGTGNAANSKDKNPSAGNLEEGFFVWHMVPPKRSANGPRGLSTWELSEGLGKPYVISSRSDHIREAIAYMDFLATPESYLNANFGAQGKGWDYTAEGSANLIDRRDGEALPDYWKRRYDMEYRQAPIDVYHSETMEFQIAGYEEAPWYEDFIQGRDDIEAAGALPPVQQPRPQFAAADSEQVKLIQTALDTYTKEMAVKFITGSQSMDDWDEYLAECEKLGASELVEIYTRSTR